MSLTLKYYQKITDSTYIIVKYDDIFFLELEDTLQFDKINIEERNIKSKNKKKHKNQRINNGNNKSDLIEEFKDQLFRKMV